MEKTILEWYEELPEPIRSQAIANYAGKRETAESQDDAIGNGFHWRLTEEGFDYWDRIHLRACDGEFDKPIESDLVKAAKKVVEFRHETIADSNLSDAIDELEKLLK